MADANPINPGDDRQIASGGATPRGLDLTDPKDQAMARKAIKRWPKRWRGVSDELKDRMVADLALASDIARSVAESAIDDEMRLKAVDRLQSGVKTTAVIEGQNAADEHREADEQRADEGKTPVGAGISFHIVQAEKPKAIE